MLQKAIEMGNDYALKFILGMKKVLQGTKDSYTLTYPLQTQSNTFWFSLTLRACNAEKTRFIMIHEDVTRSIQSKSNLRKTLNRYQIQFEQSLNGILFTDSEGKIIDANPAASDILGWSRKELLGRSDNELMDTEDKERDEVPVLIGGVPVELQDEIIAIYGVYIDISEQTEYQQKIEQAFREKETLLAELHHRVKNNLALIISLLEIQLFDSTNSS